MAQKKNNKKDAEKNQQESNAAKTPEAEVLDELHLFDPCCRRHMLTHVDIE